MSYDKNFDNIKRLFTVDGDEKTRLINSLYGTSPFASISLPQVNDDDKVHVFFTRPDLNLGSANINRDRLSAGLDNGDGTIQQYARLILDPKLNQSKFMDVVDDQSPFMSIFSNSLETLSGFPDIVMESWLGRPGIRKERVGYSDGQSKVFHSFDLDATFTNIIDEPVPIIISAWMNYMSNLREGIFTSHVHNRASRRIDYQTGIWVIVTSKNNKIKKIAKTIGYPIADPKGRHFNFTRLESKLNEGKKINVRFKCFGVDYNDPILLLEFNSLMMAFNTNIRDSILDGTKDIIEIPDRYKMMFNHRGYPLIDLRYNTLEYVINKDQYKIEDIPDDN